MPLLAFNGGKDCTAVLRLLSEQVALKDVLVVNFVDKEEEEFPEVTAFLAEVEKEYSLSLVTVRGSVQAGLWALHASHPAVRFWFLGRRSSDPYAASESHLTPCSAGWPPVIRVAPILHWTYGQVWDYLTATDTAVCKLYERGYSSLGLKSQTKPHEALRLADGSYRHARHLPDHSTERHNRK
jgi:FAD synthetase